MAYFDITITGVKPDQCVQNYCLSIVIEQIKLLIVH